MISTTLRIVLAVGVLLYFAVILIFLKKKALELKYTLLWLAAGMALLLLVIFPELLPMIVKIMGIESNMNGLFLISIMFVIAILMSITSIVSKQAKKIRMLSQTIAILEKQISEIEELYNSCNKKLQNKDIN